jgi:hypothetical protein
MPEEEKLKPSEKQVDLDTSGPEVDVTLEDTKEETVVDTAPETTEQEVEVKTEEEKKEDDSKLEDYSKGVQSRIAKLTRKMREAERKEAAALEYAAAVESKRKEDQLRFNKVDSDYNAKFEETVKSAMESAQNELRMAIESQMQIYKLRQIKKLQHLRWRMQICKCNEKKNNRFNRKHLLNYRTVDNYQIKHHNKCLKLILWLKIGLQKIDGSEQIEL